MHACRWHASRVCRSWVRWAVGCAVSTPCMLDVGDANLLYWEVCGNPHGKPAVVLGGVTTTRRTEIDWLYRGVAPLFPAQWDRFRAGRPPAERAGDLVAAYYRLLQDPDPAMHMPAAREWCTWEAALVPVDPEATP